MRGSGTTNETQPMLKCQNNQIIFSSSSPFVFTVVANN